MENKNKNRRKYDQEFKSQAVKQLLDGQLSRCQGISQSLLYRWKAELLTVSTTAQESTSPAALEAKIRKLRAQTSRTRAGYFKKSFEHFQPQDLRLLYEWIAKAVLYHPVQLLCKALAVSRSAYYEW